MQYEGNDKQGEQGEPKSVYVARISHMLPQVISKEIERQFLLSHMTIGIQDHDSHWRCHALREECVRRGNWGLHYSAVRRAKRIIRSVQKIFQ